MEQILAFTINTSQNATFAGDVSASNLSGTNTGDQDLSGYSLTTDLDDYLPLSAGSTKPLTGDLYIDSIIRNNSGDLEIRNQTASGFATATKLKQQTANGLETFLTFDGTSRNAYFTNQGNVGIGTPDSPLGKLQVNEYTVASQGTQGVHGELSVFTNSGDESLFLGIKDAAYPNRGWALNPVANGVNARFTN